MPARRFTPEIGSFQPMAFVKITVRGLMALLALLMALLAFLALWIALLALLALYAPVNLAGLTPYTFINHFLQTVI